MKASITVDMEHDCPPYLTTYRGVTEGTPRLLALFDAAGVRATFFTTGDVARKHPDVIERIVAAGHELGCHGDTHTRFSALDEAGAERELRDATATLRRFAEVTSFRAPNLDLPAQHVPLLARHGFRLDSSHARYKRGSLLAEPTEEHGLLRIPASVTSSVLRLPKLIRHRFFAGLRAPAVLFVHPWEFVDFTRSSLRLDCRFRTGEPALRCLGESLAYFKARGADFRPMRELSLTS